MIQQYIDNLLGSVNKKFIKETFSKYELEFPHNDVSEYQNSLTKEYYQLLNDYLCQLVYKWDLVIDDLSYSISQENYQSLKIDEIDETANILVRFNIYKSGKEILIIDNTVFNKYLKSISLEDLLKNINSLENYFILNNKRDQFQIEVDKTNTVEISQQCHFRNQNIFSYNPDTFYFSNIDSSTDSILDDYFLKLSQVFTFIYLFDSSEIEGNNLHLSISGNLTYKYSIDFTELDASSLKFYHQIYKWIYSEKNKIEDKLSLSKNIITSYITADSLEINESVFNSILSSNKIYIKGNISKYFEVRNKIIDQIEETIGGVNKSIEAFSNNFQKSVFVFISFFLSVFIFKIVNKKSDVDKIFNEETSTIGVGFIIVSIIFLLVSIAILFFDVQRLKTRYKNVKKRYQDVLVQDDIDKILDEDYEYKNEMKYMTKRVIAYGIIWVLTIITFTVVLFLTSDYLNLAYP
jgi:hypothetical protein